MNQKSIIKFLICQINFCFMKLRSFSRKAIYFLRQFNDLQHTKFSLTYELIVRLINHTHQRSLATMLESHTSVHQDGCHP